MKKGIQNLIWMAVAVILASGTAVLAQTGTQPATKGQQQPAKPGAAPAGQAAPAATPQTPPVNKEEEDAYTAFFNGKALGNEKQVQLGEEFVVKYPQSRYTESVYGKMAGIYQSLNQEQKMFAAGDKALEMNPDNVDVLTLIGWALPRRTNPKDLDADQKLQKSERYSKHAIDLINAMTKPENFAEADFAKAKNERLSMAYSGLGMVYYFRSKYPDMVSSFEQATKLSANPDPADFYLLAEGYKSTKRFNDAVTAYTKCSEMPWAWQSRCKSELETAKKNAATQLSAPAPTKP
ncbi:MAG: hypothetical protein HY046_07795 [Acidobacteria bacterium]|nr:hypothetical protein [Acidobacteriota bacterium]